MSTIEIVRMRVEDDDRNAFVGARAAMEADFRADREGFMSALLVDLGDGTYLDIIEWATPADFAASRAKGANQPGIARFFGIIAEIISSDEGTVVDVTA